MNQPDFIIRPQLKIAALTGVIIGVSISLILCVTCVILSCTIAYFKQLSIAIVLSDMMHSASLTVIMSPFVLLVMTFLDWLSKRRSFIGVFKDRIEIVNGRKKKVVSMHDIKHVVLGGIFLRIYYGCNNEVILHYINATKSEELSKIRLMGLGQMKGGTGSGKKSNNE